MELWNNGSGKLLSESGTFQLYESTEKQPQCSSGMGEHMDEDGTETIKQLHKHVMFSLNCTLIGPIQVRSFLCL